MLRAYQLTNLIENAMAEKGYGSMPITVVVAGKIYNIKDVSWCANYSQFHIHAEPDALESIKEETDDY